MKTNRRNFLKGLGLTGFGFPLLKSGFFKQEETIKETPLETEVRNFVTGVKSLGLNSVLGASSYSFSGIHSASGGYMIYQQEIDQMMTPIEDRDENE